MLTETNYATFNPPLVPVFDRCNSDQTCEKVSHCCNKFFTTLASGGCWMGCGLMTLVIGFPLMITGFNSNNTQFIVGLGMVVFGLTLGFCGAARPSPIGTAPMPNTNYSNNFNIKTPSHSASNHIKKDAPPVGPNRGWTPNPHYGKNHDHRRMNWYL